MTWNEIDQYNKKRFEKPIYSATLQRGIYVTFKDFLDNRIDNSPFETSFGKQTDQLYIIYKADKKLFSDFWAFCDGNKLYINGGFNFNELIKTDNGYEFWGNARVIDHIYNPQFRSQSTAPTDLLAGLAHYGMDKLTAPPKNFLIPFQVNMENGSVY